MISQLKLQETDLWEAWIEFDQFSPIYFGTLYVTGEICIAQRLDQPLISKANIDGKTLILQIPSRPVGRSRMKEVMYSEPLENLNCYKSISIYSGFELIAHFNEIEIMI
jgi:hypothetical protein